MSDRYFGINRYLCSVLDDMRKCCETLNFSPMKGLVEEAQILGNRMESGLSDKKNLMEVNEEYRKARKKYKTLQKEIKALEERKKKLSPKEPKK